MRRRALLGALVALAIATSACGIPIQGTATKLPAQLQLPATTSTTQPASNSNLHLLVYFIRAGRLFPLEEYYPTSNNPNAALQAALFWLSNGPTAVQAKCGVTSSLLAPTSLTMEGSPHNGIVTVDVGSNFFGLEGIPLEEASAQIVWSLTGQDTGVTEVELTYDHIHIETYVPPGTFVNRAVNRADYAPLAPTGETTCPAGGQGTSG